MLRNLHTLYYDSEDTITHAVVQVWAKALALGATARNVPPPDPDHIQIWVDMQAAKGAQRKSEVSSQGHFDFVRSSLDSDSRS